jgi:hypothetical protein
MTPVVRKLLRFAAVGVLTATQPGCWEGTTRTVQATILASEGLVTTSNIGGTSAPLTPGAHPGMGEILETTGASRVAIALLPNLLVQLEPGTRLEIVRLAITKDGNETGAAMQGRYAEAKLLKGRMFVSQVWGEALAKFIVKTSQGELVTTSNALFDVEDDADKTRATCVSGSVGFQPRATQSVMRIPPGFVGQWSGTNSILVAAETDERAQESLIQGLEIEQKLRQLTSEKRFALPR